MRLRYLAAAPLVAVAMVGTTAAAWPSSTAAVPQAPPALTARALSDRYTAEAKAIKTAERAAIRHRNSQLASALAGLAPRQVLFFNPNGQGVAAMVIGNLATATRVAILVPGSDTTLATFFSRGPASPGRRRRSARRAGTPARTLRPGGAAGGHCLARLPRPGHAQPGRDDLGRRRAGGAGSAAAGHRTGPARRPGRAAVPQLRVGGLRAGCAAPAGHRHRGVRQPGGWAGSTSPLAGSSPTCSASPGPSVR